LPFFFSGIFSMQVEEEFLSKFVAFLLLCFIFLNSLPAMTPWIYYTWFLCVLKYTEGRRLGPRSFRLANHFTHGEIENGEQNFFFNREEGFCAVTTNQTHFEMNFLFYFI
jgi:hypothetical protein